MAVPRRVTEADRRAPRPVYAVWEITLRCDHACSHCGSRAETARPDELSTEELLEVADQLVRIGTREVTLIGGEAYLRSDVYDLIAHLRAGGIRVAIQTGGLGMTERRVAKLAEVGLQQVGVSIDGPEAVHDLQRGRPGSWRAGMEAIRRCRAAGMGVTSNTQVNQLTMGHLAETADFLYEAGVRVWRTQITVPMGRAADRPEWILQPWQMLEVMDTLADIKIAYLQKAKDEGKEPRQAFVVMIGNNVGYYGPHEQLLRTYPGGKAAAWSGCSAGRYTLGIESDGRIKGCPSLPTAPYIGGNIRDLTLQQIWDETPELRFTRDRTSDELWGFCKTCYYADVCRAGCSFTAHCTMGRRGNNPFCYHRAATYKKQGLRERLVHKEAPGGLPYDFGRFETALEPWED